MPPGLLQLVLVIGIGCFNVCTVVALGPLLGAAGAGYACSARLAQCIAGLKARGRIVLPRVLQLISILVISELAFTMGTVPHQLITNVPAALDAHPWPMQPSRATPNVSNK